jgi:hypothetical protein
LVGAEVTLGQYMPAVKHFQSSPSIADLAVCADQTVMWLTHGMSDTLSGWIDQALRPRYGTMRAIAELIGMSESGFTRGVKRGTLSVENLLDLARATDTQPSTVLRMAGKERVEKLIELLYGASELSASEREHLRKWRSLDREAKAAIETLMRELPEEDVDTKPAKRKKSA